jgi:hypothetical protein
MTTFASYVGTNTDRQSVGLPGHCERCVREGHVAAHPALGCADVGCLDSHTANDQPSCHFCGEHHRPGTACPDVADHWESYS